MADILFPTRTKKVNGVCAVSIIKAMIKPIMDAYRDRKERTFFRSVCFYIGRKYGTAVLRAIASALDNEPEKSEMHLKVHFVDGHPTVEQAGEALYRRYILGAKDATSWD